MRTDPANVRNRRPISCVAASITLAAIRLFGSSFCGGADPGGGRADSEHHPNFATTVAEGW